MVRLRDDRCRLRRELGLLRVRVGLQRQLAVGGEDLVLVARARLDAGQEQLPDPGRAQRAHRVQAPVPGVEVADDADRASGRRPHRKRGAHHGLVGPLAHVRAEAVVHLLVAALRDQVQVELAERRQERVRVVDRERAGGAVVDLEAVVQGQLGAFDDALEDAAGVDRLELDGAAVVKRCRDRGRRGTQRADRDASVLRVGAEHGVGVSVLAAHQRLEFLLGNRHVRPPLLRGLRRRRGASAPPGAGGLGFTHAASSRRLIPATGIEIQSGRLSSS